MPRQANTVAILTAKDSKEAELEALLRDMANASRAEPGNLQYDVWRDRDMAGRFVIVELYADDDAVATHRATAHFQAYLSRIGDLADRLSVVGHAVDVL